MASAAVVDREPVGPQRVDRDQDDVGALARPAAGGESDRQQGERSEIRATEEGDARHGGILL